MPDQSSAVATAPSRSVDVAVDRIGELFAVGSDDEDGRLRKAVMVTSVLLICIGGVVWAVVYGWLGQWRSAAIPAAYVLLSLANLAYFYLSKRDRYFLVAQLTLILLLPFILQWSAGGFVPSGAVMLWAILAPVGALMFHSSRKAMLWFVAYLALVAASVLIDPWLEPAVTVTELQIAVSFAFNVIMVSTILFLLLRHFVAANAAAKQRSDRLLLNILPSAITERLKAGERPIVDRFDSATIVFADIVNFTSMSAAMEPEDVVALLDDLFDGFDALADDLGLEKVKTVGDAYIVASGVPTRRSDHAAVAAQMALAMRDHVGLVADRRRLPVVMRFGIHCGPVVAGVIGTNKLSYSLWGDTVNIASRMESSGIANRIQASESIRFELSGEFLFELRGEIDIKGKGPMCTYLLERA